MSRSMIAFGCLSLFVFALPVAAQAPLKSGLQTGEKIETIFEPLNVNGEHAGEPHCLVCENGLNPVAMIFARDVNEPLVSLIAQLDAQVAKNKKFDMGCFVVFLGDQETLQPKLAEVAKKQQLKHVILAIDPAAGPEGFNVAKEADVTVVLYERHTVAANHAFAKDKLTAKSVDAILADVPKILKK
jgi:hypothetical protein